MLNNIKAPTVVNMDSNEEFEVMDSDLADKILNRLNLMLDDDNNKLSLMDMKDISAMYKNIIGTKGGAVGVGNSDGLSGFFSRLKA